MALVLCLAGTAEAEVTAAEYDAPTRRYTHGVLGDDVEWGALKMALADGRTVRLVLPEDRVFEDTAPRLADVDLDGTTEVRVWRFEDGRLREVANAVGFTNHRIGEGDIAGGIRDCGAGPEMIVADADWRASSRCASTGR